MPSRPLPSTPWTLAVALCAALALPAAAQASQALAEKAGCPACHQVATKLVGPSYKDVAAKYKGRADAVPYLAKRVRQGGPGNWGQVPMMANDVSRISDADLNALLAWVLKTN